MNENRCNELAARAQQFLLSGRFERAKALYEELCRLDSDNEEMWLMLAVAQAESGALEDAVPSADRAIALDRDYVEAYLTRAHMLKRLGRSDAAQRSALEAVERDEEYTEAWLFLAGLAGQLNNPEDAEIWAGKAVELAPENVDAYINLANAQYQLGKHHDACINYRQALRLQPTSYQGKLGLAKTLLALANYHEAESEISDLLNRNANDPDILHCLAHLHLGRNQIDEALGLLGEIIEAHAHFKPAHLSIARVYYQQHDLDKAIDCLSTTRQLFPDQADVLHALGSAYAARGYLKPALDCFENALAIAPDDLEMRLTHANLVADTGDFERAIALFDALKDKHPNDVRPLIARANLLDKLGHHETAYELLLPFVASASPPPAAANAFGQLCHRFRESDRGITLLERTLRSTELSDTERRMLLFTLGKLYDIKGDFDKAFECLRKGNELKPCKYNHRDVTKYIDRLIAFPTDTFLRQAQSGVMTNESITPVFIVGMPRSGTSLIEQIIASHPRATGLGERSEVTEIVDRLPATLGETGTYPECLVRLPEESLEQARSYYLGNLKGLAENTALITDKMPSNFHHLPLILRLFPHARIIHCRRDPLDTCLSCYFQDFGGYHSYAYRLDSLGKYYREYERLMRHYREDIGIPMLEIRYEDLVSEPEQVTREIIAYCGLEWDDACLTHHQSDHITRTASYSQVREPIYTRSVGRWKFYENHLEDLKKTLGDTGPRGSIFR